VPHPMCVRHPDTMRVTALLTLALVLLPDAAASQSRTDADVARWRAAVRAHQPGTLPASTRALGEWSWDRLGPVMDELRLRGTVHDLLRGAALYLDLAIEVPLAQRPVYPTRGGAVYSQDGRPLSTHRLDSQIWTARTLVVRAMSRAGTGETERGLARRWFRTVAAVFAQRLNFADLQPHLSEALTHLPEDPGLLFDAGCAAEILASPLIQATLMSGLPQSTAGRRLQTPAAELAHTNRPAAFLATAEKHYRAALMRDPRDLESRVRLGRVLAELQRHGQAVAELQAAARLHGPPILQYYTALFLGDVLTDLGQLDDALAAFERAAALFPDADSPRLGISRVHSERGDAAAARRALGTSLDTTPSAAIGADPRWQYNRCSGRDAHAAYAAYVEQFRKELQ
jgi:cytochrome c-type biogenesis protein CcmH/NrfG